MQMLADRITVGVVVPDHSQIAIGTISSIIRQSKLPRRLFEEA